MLTFFLQIATELKNKIAAWKAEQKNKKNTAMDISP